MLHQLKKILITSLLVCPLWLCSCKTGIDTIDEKVLGNKKDPETIAQIHNLRGMQFSTQGDYASACKMFTEALKHSEKAGIYNNLGRCYFWLGRYDDALKAFAKADEMGMDDPNLYANIADVFAHRKQDTDAIRYYHKALSYDSDLTRAHYELGNIFLKQGHYQSAEKRFNKVLKLDPSNSKALLSRLIAYRMMHDFEKAYQDMSDLDRRGFIIQESLRESVIAGLKSKKQSEYKSKLLR